MIASRTIAAPPARMTRPPAVRDGLMSRTSPRSRSSTTMPRPIDLMHIVRSGTFGAGMEAGLPRISLRSCPAANVLRFPETARDPVLHPPTPPAGGGGLDAGAPVGQAFSPGRGGPGALAQLTFLYSVLAARLSGTAITHGEYGKHSFERTEHNPARGRRADQKYQLTQFFHVSPDCPLSLALRGSVSTKEPHRPMPNVIITCQDQRHERCASHDASDRQTQDRRFQGPTRRYHHQRLEDRIARFSGGHNGSMAVQVEPAGRTIRSNRAAGSQQSWRPPRFRWPELWAGCTIPRSV